ATPPAPAATAAAPAAPARAETPAAAAAKPPAPEPARAAEPGPVVKAGPNAEPMVVQAIDEPQARPYKDGDWRPEFHVVKKGDTLYSIALDYGQDYRELAAWNHLQDPGVIKVDQKLRLFPPEGMAEAPVATADSTAAAAPAVPVKSEPRARKLPYSEQALAQLKIPAPKPAVSNLPPASVAPPKPAAPKPASAATREAAADGRLTWEWPARGKLGYGFGQGANQKGMGIEGRMGDAILAAAPGRVVYSGSGLRGYGKLVIIKHNATFLSVYAHNSQVLVKEGQSVAKGQKIAEMGDTDSNKVGLHFEIRRQGKPTDPLQYLPEHS
ncbi:MAG TPA: peptidoglycan DD-metalloendopeptidase family protein, partial [Burkholderiales bacterium]|nr:peptidoglycan DD-metalloendopeptidase family protein [Burkholderiales bacterium]